MKKLRSFLVRLLFILSYICIIGIFASFPLFLAFCIVSWKIAKYMLIILAFFFVLIIGCTCIEKLLTKSNK